MGLIYTLRSFKPDCFSDLWSEILPITYVQRAVCKISFSLSESQKELFLLLNLPLTLPFILKVSSFKNVLLVSSISSKNKRKQVHLRFYSRKVEFVCLFFGGNVGLKNSLQLCLTFRTFATTHTKKQYIYLRLASKAFRSIFRGPGTFHEREKVVAWQPTAMYESRSTQ